MTTNPHDLTVTTCTHPEHAIDSCGCGDPRHTWIQISNTFDALNCDDLTTVIDSYRWTANLIARIALALTTDLEHDQREHHCHRDNPNDTRPNCGIELQGRLAWHHPDHTADPHGPTSPLIVITIPTRRLKHYERRIQRALTDITKGDKWKPTHTQQAAWRHAPDPNAPAETDTRTRELQEQHR